MCPRCTECNCPLDQITYYCPICKTFDLTNKLIWENKKAEKELEKTGDTTAKSRSHLQALPAIETKIIPLFKT